MSQNISLRETERRVFTSAYRDGLWDILIGCVILQFAIAPLLSRSLGDFWSSAVFVPFWALVFLAIWLIRKRVVTPRVGTVKFGSWRRARLTRFNVITLVLLLVTFIFGILSAVGSTTLPGWIHMARFSVIILVIFSVAAFFLDFTHLYVYGVLFALSPLVGEWLWRDMGVPHHGFPLTFGTSSAIAILVGLVKFIRLMREHPLPDEEGPSEGASDD